MNTSLPSIPSSISDWDIETIEMLLPISSIEGDTFDFKGRSLNYRYDELYNDFCAMSNSLGGILVLGVSEKKAPDESLIGFVKNGFDIGYEDKVNQTISNNRYNVEPIPHIESRIVYDQKESKFYPIIKITAIDINCCTCTHRLHY